jgi:Protein of unknown function (DUF642)
MMSRFRFVLLSSVFVGVAGLHFAPAASANLLVNGGFEAPALTPGAFTTIAPGGEPAGFAWKVASGDVDVAHLPVTPFVDYSAFEGNQGLDLNGTMLGAIYQDFATVAGQSYSLSLAYADNPDHLAVVKSASINVQAIATSGVLLATSISHSTSTNSPPIADWLTATFGFTATGASTRLTFSSTSADTSPSGGIILDAIDTRAVPEPTSAALLVAALASLLAVRTRFLPPVL